MTVNFTYLSIRSLEWRQEEMERINTNHSGPERKAALVGLLEQETYLIQSIERHRINADQLNEEEFIMKTLEKVLFLFLKFSKKLCKHY